MSQKTPSRTVKSEKNPTENGEISLLPCKNYTVKIKKEIPDTDCQAVAKLPAGVSSEKRIKKPVSLEEVKKIERTISRIKCIQVNQALQKKIGNALNQLTAYMKENLTKQDELLEAAKLQEKTYTDGKIRHTKPISLFAAPYFRDIRGMIPPENEDTLEKLKRKDVTAYLQPPRPWCRAEKDRLLEGVAASALNIVLKPYKSKRDHLKAKLKNQNILDFELEIIKKNVFTIEKNIRQISERPLEDILEEAKDKIDWMTISATNLQGSKSYEECEIMWKNYLSNTVNKEPFSRQEDNLLKKLVKRHKERDWDTIAKELKTNRTAIQCLERYQTHINEDLTKRYWTPEEDSHLMKTIDSVKIGKYIPWNKVCCYMEGRTRHQIITRYERTISREIKRLPFSTEEDAMLLACHKKFGVQWTKMKDYLPGRPSYTVRERYVNTLDPTLKIGDWCVEEDERLIVLVKKYGFGKWSQCAREMPGRTDNMCLVRAQRIVDHTKRRYKSEPTKYDEDGEPILYPAAPTKLCKVQNEKLRTIRNSAMSTLISALEKIEPYVDEEIDMETLDLSAISQKTLRILKEELLGKESTGHGESYEEWRPHYLPPPFLRAINFRGDKSTLELEDYISSECEDEDDPEIYQEDEDYFEDVPSDDKDFFLSASDRIWLHNVLRQKLSEEAFLHCTNKVSIKRPSFALGAVNDGEVSFYRSYLMKKFHCQKSYDEEEDLSKLTPNQQITRSELSDVVRYFIQPDLEEDDPIVLCPNITTLSSMEVMEATRPRLRRTAGYIQQSKSYLQYIVGHTEEKPKCTKCKGGESDPDVLDDLLKSMQSRLLIVDDTMQSAAETELGFPSEKCVCEQLAKSRDDFNLLQRRFLSIFLWPSLLSSIEPSREQEGLIQNDVAKRYKVDPELAEKYRKTKKNTRIRDKKREKRIFQQRNKNWSNNCKNPSGKNGTNIRRSKRSCVVNRKSFALSENEEEEI